MSLGGVRDEAEIEAAVSASPYPIETLPAEPESGAACLHALQVTTASWLGSIVYCTGGLIVDDGWLRIFGSGDPVRGLPDIHAANEYSDGGGLVVAQDVLGGEFAWRPTDGEHPPTIQYFAPDLLSWEDLTLGYSDWLYAMLGGSVDRFYQSSRWPGWQDEVAECPLDLGILSREGGASRSLMPMPELVRLLHTT